MTTFFTSDTHFGHKNIIHYCNRPFEDFAHMDEVLIRNWNRLVGDTDVVFHLGDVALGDSERWQGIFDRLNGYKVLVVGNHDRIFAGEKERQRIKWDEKYHEWFDEVYDNITGHVLSNGSVVNLSHFPYDGDSHDGDRYSAYRLVDEGVPLIHGHTHSNGVYSQSVRGTQQIHVGVDAWHYAPVPESEVLHLLDRPSLV